MTTQTSLASQLKEFQAEFLQKAPEEAVSVMQKATTDLELSGIINNSLKVGEAAPDFTLPNAVGENVKLSELLSNGPVIINFYRGEWCPYCNIELHAFQQLLPEFQQVNAQLVAISPSLPTKALTMQEKHELAFPVLSDVGNKVARSYGLVFTLDAALRPLYKGFGLDIPGHNGDESYELPVPATYVIDTTGIVRYAYANADYTQRAEPAEVLAAVKAL
ncbi:MAG: peroxiredoxin-like family protein [Phormidesmis sp.]